MSEERMVLYFNRLRGEEGTDGDSQCQVWTALIDSSGNLQEFFGCARLAENFRFSRRIVHETDSPYAKAQELITGKRLFEGYQICLQPFLIDLDALEARPDYAVPPLTGVEGESLLQSPLFYPGPSVARAPTWFF